MHTGPRCRITASQLKYLGSFHYPCCVSEEQKARRNRELVSMQAACWSLLGLVPPTLRPAALDGERASYLQNSNGHLLICRFTRPSPCSPTHNNLIFLFNYLFYSSCNILPKIVAPGSYAPRPRRGFCLLHSKESCSVPPVKSFSK